MSIQGNLDTMSLQEILRWAQSNAETGVLELERSKTRKRIAFRDGHVVGCSSDDPPSRIGQFLLSRGKISEEALTKALEIQKEQNKNLGEILQDMGEIEVEELAYELSAKAEENLFGMFDWTHAVFRFQPGEPNDPWMLDYRAPLEEILNRGTQRRELLGAIRRLFLNSGVVLQHGSETVPEEIGSISLVQRILASIDGERTIGEVLFHAHASQFLVLKFLASAVHSGVLTIAEIRHVDPQNPTLLDDVQVSADAPESGPQSAAADVPDAASTFEEKIEVVQSLLARKESRAALDVIDECYEERPGADFLAHLMHKAESMFVSECREGEFANRLVPTRIPGTLLEPSEVSTSARFLLETMGEGHSIQTLSWIAPMREIDVFRALAALKQAGLIELVEGEEQDPKAKAPTVEWA